MADETRYRRTPDGEVVPLAQAEADALAADQARWTQAEEARATTPTTEDFLDAIRELAAEGAQVESRINERAAQKAHERASK